tara:strand:+ start:71 stop:232 length:162 start_codon:yes stop_codon:yes gene_type:complete
MIRIFREGVVVYESDNLYDIADWLYYEEQGVKDMVVTVNYKEVSKRDVQSRSK